MSERDAGSKPANGKRVQSGLPPGALFGTAVVMMVATANGLGHLGPAAAVVGIVLAEAIALYVGYGALTRAVDPVLRRLVASD